MNEPSLSMARPGDQCVVLRVEPKPPELRGQLYALGVIPGSKLEVLHRAPLGDPLQVRVGGSYISIRKSEADVIAVEMR